MNNEFEDMLSIIEIFCDSPKTKSKLNTFSEDLKNGKPGQNKRRRPNGWQQNLGLPIQCVTEYDGKSIVEIRANSVSSIVACHHLYSSSLIHSNTFLEYINARILSHGDTYTTTDLAAVIASQIQKNNVAMPPAHATKTDTPPHAKPTEKALDKPAEKAIDKPTEKALDKPTEKALGKPAEKALDKTYKQLSTSPQKRLLTRPRKCSRCFGQS